MYAICVVISYWRGDIVNGCDNTPFMSIGMISELFNFVHVFP